MEPDGYARFIPDDSVLRAKLFEAASTKPRPRHWAYQLGQEVASADYAAGRRHEDPDDARERWAPDARRPDDQHNFRVGYRSKREFLTEI